MPSRDHRQLLLHLNNLVRQERWQKMPKGSGKILKKSMTKSGNVKLVLGGKKKETICYVLKRNSNLYAIAEQVKKGDQVSVALRRYLGKMYCVRLSKKEEKTGRGTTLGEYADGP